MDPFKTTGGSRHPSHPFYGVGNPSSVLKRSGEPRVPTSVRLSFAEETAVRIAVEKEFLEGCKSVSMFMRYAAVKLLAELAEQYDAGELASKADPGLLDARSREANEQTFQEMYELLALQLARAEDEDEYITVAGRIKEAADRAVLMRHRKEFEKLMSQRIH